MSPPNLDIGALRMLESAGYLWSDTHHGYRRKRRQREPSSVYHHRAPIVIELEELEDHGLVAPNLILINVTLHLNGLARESGKPTEK
jgi:hypothetical protein